MCGDRLRDVVCDRACAATGRVTWCVTGRVAVTGHVTGCGHARSQGSENVGIKPFSTGCDWVWALHVTQSRARSRSLSRPTLPVTVCMLGHADSPARTRHGMFAVTWRVIWQDMSPGVDLVRFVMWAVI